MSVQSLRVPVGHGLQGVFLEPTDIFRWDRRQPIHLSMCVLQYITGMMCKGLKCFMHGPSTTMYEPPVRLDLDPGCKNI